MEEILSRVLLEIEFLTLIELGGVRTGLGTCRIFHKIGKCKRHNVEKLKKDKRDDTCKGKVKNLIGITIRLFSLYFLFE